MKPEVRQCIIIGCAVVLALGLVAGSASAGVGNWIVHVKAYSDLWTGLDKNVTIGVQGAGTVIVVPGGIAANKVETVATDGTDYWTGKTLASGTTDGSFDLKIGQGSAAYTKLNINIYNLATSLGNDQALDTNLVYKFKNGAGDVLATFSSAANHYAWMVNWNNISEIMKPTGWANGTADRGWFYVDTTPTTGATWADLENYQFTFEQAPPPTMSPEPGSLLALGSSLIGLAGLALRRRRA